MIIMEGIHSSFCKNSLKKAGRGGRGSNIFVLRHANFFLPSILLKKTTAGAGVLFQRFSLVLLHSKAAGLFNSLGQFVKHFLLGFVRRKIQTVEARVGFG